VSRFGRALAERPVGRGLTLGALAGLGAVALAPRLGAGCAPGERTLGSTAAAVAGCALGGLAAGLVTRAIARRGVEDFASPYP
jgi:hypothetical protein